MRSSGYHLLLFFILLTAIPAFSQEGSIKPSRSEAEAAWDIGDYETAYRHYNALLLLYSRDPLYKYYTGACLVRMERDPSRAVTLLESAINSSQNVKTVPDDVWFYYGRALQMCQRTGEATVALEKFGKIAGKRKAQEYELQGYIDQCSSANAVSRAIGVGKKMEREAGAREHSLQNRSSKGINPVEIPKQTDTLQINAGDIPSPDLRPVAETMEGQVKDEKVPENYDIKLSSAVKLQFEADSISRAAAMIRQDMERSTPEKKSLLMQKAEELEKEASGKQAQADEIYLTLEPGIVNPETDSIPEQDENPENDADQAPEPLQPESDKGIPVYSLFEVRDSPPYSTNNPIPVGKETISGLVYRIQLAAFKNPVPASHFRGLYPIAGKIKPENGVTYYYTGMFRSVEAARAALQKVRSAGFPDAFIIAMVDDAVISMERATVLEQQWSKIPLMYEKKVDIVKEKPVVADTVAVGTLYFRAEVLRSKKPVKPEVTEKMSLLAGRRGFDIIKNKAGETLYLIGNFITFESAEEYVSLLVRNGYSSAKVVAYVGTREIAVDVARELLKKLTDD